MVCQDTISSIYTLIAAHSTFNTARTTTPTDFGLSIFNLSQKWLLQHRKWTFLHKKITGTLDANRKIQLPSDYGTVVSVYEDPSGTGKPTRYFNLEAADVTERYEEESTIDGTTGARTLKFVFPSYAQISGSLYIVYVSTLSDATQADITSGKKSVFPASIMVPVSKKIMQDYYGVAANQDPNWINLRVSEEIELFSKYANDSNAALDWSVKDAYGEPLRIGGMGLDGSSGGYNGHYPYLPATMRF